MPNVFLNDAAFARLRSSKKKDQSFSDVVLAKVKPELDVDEFFGAFKHTDAKRALKELQEERRRS